jgi:uncharacterized membrane protein required for colicin V production
MIADIVIISIIVFFIVVGVIRGFAKALLNIAGVILSVVVACFVSQGLSQWVFDSFIRNEVLDSINSINLESGMNSVVSDIFSVLPEWIGSVVEFFNGLFGLENKETLNLFTDVLPDDTMTPAVLTDSIIAPVITGILSFFIGIILFIVALIIVKQIIDLIDKIFELPVLKQINGFLGGVFGAIEGLIIVSIAINLFCFIVNMTEPSVLTDNSVNGILFPLLRFEF